SRRRHRLHQHRTPHRGRAGPCGIERGHVAGSGPGCGRPRARARAAMDAAAARGDGHPLAGALLVVVRCAMTLLTTVIAFIIALGSLILFHELGHYLVARALGVKVLRFSIGFGRPLVSRTYGADRTEWVIAAFPLGGYVKMVDEREGRVSPADLPRAFNRQSVYRRFAIVAAGPIANFLLA